MKKEISTKELTEQAGQNRRSLLKAMGVGGIALALGGVAPLSAFKPEGIVADSSSVRQVPNVASLLSVQTSGLKDGDKFFVGGYYAEGDGGAKMVSWVANSNKPDNGGTVHNPFGSNAERGRFEVVHNGVGDYRWFGIFNEEKTADDAFEAMVYDESLDRIEAHSNLLFQKRHKVTRSRITLNFNNFKIYTYGIETGKKDDPFGAVFFFTGKTYGKVKNFVLTEDMPEYYDTFEIDDATQYAIGDYLIAICDNNEIGREAKELQKMLRIVQIVDYTHIRVDYKLGWPLAAGRKISYQRVEPVKDVRIENMQFEGNGRPTTTDGGSGSSCIAFEFAVRCDIFNIHATQVFWPLCIRRYNNHYQTVKCSLYNPVEIQVGGTGYLTQQIHCIHGSVRDCVSAQARHLNDFTNCAYCQVENCHGIGDGMGPYVTHGQYEHDLSYIGNSGLLSFANSGPTWGRAARNITVKKHVGSRVIAENYITDLTLEDIYTFRANDIVNDGSIWANVDGLVMKNCHAEAQLSLSQKCNRTTRPNVIEGSSFKAIKGYYFGRANTANTVHGIITQDITFRDCKLYDLDENYYMGTGALYFDHCTFVGAAEDGSSVALEMTPKKLELNNCLLQNIGFKLSGEQAQMLKITGGTRFEGNCTAFLEVANTAAPVEIEIGEMTYEPANSGKFLIFADGAKIKRMKMIGATMIGGSSAIGADALASGGFIYIANCIHQGYNLGPMPAEAKNVQYNTGNLNI